MTNQRQWWNIVGESHGVPGGVPVSSKLRHYVVTAYGKNLTDLGPEINNRDLCLSVISALGLRPRAEITERPRSRLFI